MIRDTLCIYMHFFSKSALSIQNNMCIQYILLETLHPFFRFVSTSRIVFFLAFCSWLFSSIIGSTKLITFKTHFFVVKCYFMYISSIHSFIELCTVSHSFLGTSHLFPPYLEILFCFVCVNLFLQRHILEKKAAHTNK